MCSNLNPNGTHQQVWLRSISVSFVNIVWPSWKSHVLRTVCWRSFLVCKYKDRHTAEFPLFCHGYMRTVHWPLEQSTSKKKKIKEGIFSREYKFSRDSETTQGLEGDRAASFSPALAFLPSFTIRCSFPINVLLLSKVSFHRGFLETLKPQS